MKKWKIVSIFLVLSLLTAFGVSYFLYDFSQENQVKPVSQEQSIETKIDDEVTKALNELSKENEEAKLWLEIANINLSEGLVQGIDNDFYLTHNNKKASDRDGALFIDYEVSIDETKGETPDNLIVYGHNMENHRVFSDLKYFGDRTFLENSEKIVITDKSGKKVYYEPFLFARVNVEEEFFPYHTWIFWDEVDSAKAYYEGMKRHSILEKTMEIHKEDKLLTLSTCDNAYDDARFVLIAKEIKEIK